MSYYMGIDIGGTKIAGAVFDEDGKVLAQKKLSTPVDYPRFLEDCSALVNDLENLVKERCKIGVGVPGIIDSESGCVSFVTNLPFLRWVPLRHELSEMIGREVRLANDANCAALAEAIDGAGKGYNTVFGLVIGTGVGGSFICNGKLVEGANGFAGEIGLLPLPFREEADGPMFGHVKDRGDCIENAISGPALARLYKFMTGINTTAEQIAKKADAGDKEALGVLDRYYEIVAKAMNVILYSFDPQVVVISGGLSDLPGFYNGLSKRCVKYTLTPSLKTEFVRAKHGSMAGMRGAAWLWR